MIGTFPNSTNYQHISTHIADYLVGEYNLEEAYPEDANKPAWYVWSERANFLAALIVTYNFLDKVGEIEHTNDWDWRITIETTDGRMFPDPDDEGTMIDTMTSSMADDFPHIATDHGERVYRNMPIAFELYHWDTDEPTSDDLDLKLEDIRSITIERL